MASRSELFNYMVENGRQIDKEESKKLVFSSLDKFVFNLQFGKTFEVEYDVKKEFEKLFHKYCNDYGKSETKIGEIIRGLMKLCYRYENDGDDIEVGSYSGIWYGLKERLNCPFMACDNGVEWFNNHNHFDIFNSSISHGMGKDYVSNIALNALVLETFEQYESKTSVDISNYYENIVKFLANEEVINKFAEYGLDITNNFGSYSYTSQYGDDDESLVINTIYEDMTIEIPNEKNGYYVIRFNNIEVSFYWDSVDKFLCEYKEALQYLMKLATVEYKRCFCQCDIEKELREIGYESIDCSIKKIA